MQWSQSKCLPLTIRFNFKTVALFDQRTFSMCVTQSESSHVMEMALEAQSKTTHCIVLLQDCLHGFLQDAGKNEFLSWWVRSCPYSSPRSPKTYASSPCTLISENFHTTMGPLLHLSVVVCPTGVCPSPSLTYFPRWSYQCSGRKANAFLILSSQWIPWKAWFSHNEPKG